MPTVIQLFKMIIEKLLEIDSYRALQKVDRKTYELNGFAIDTHLNQEERKVLCFILEAYESRECMFTSTERMENIELPQTLKEFDELLITSYNKAIQRENAYRKNFYSTGFHLGGSYYNSLSGPNRNANELAPLIVALGALHSPNRRDQSYALMTYIHMIAVAFTTRNTGTEDFEKLLDPKLRIRNRYNLVSIYSVFDDVDDVCDVFC